MTSRESDYFRALTAPRSVALVGASDDPTKLTARPQRFLTANGFTGKVFPINPTRDTVLGLPAFRSVLDVGEPIDFAYLMVGTERVIDAVRECGEAGVRVVSVLADGFAEAGEEGRKRQAELVETARRAGIFLIGPNSMGAVNTENGFVCTTNAAFRENNLRKGKLTVLSQSGSIIGTVLSRGHARGIGFSKFFSLGNEASVGIGELGLALVDDPSSEGFLLFIETLRDAPALAEFGRRAAELGKPVVAYVLGRSSEGQELAVSHTGALTGSSRAIASFLDAHGIRRADLFDTFLEAPAALARIRPAAGRSRDVTVVSTTGGGGAMVIDQLGIRGVGIGRCSAPARAALESAGIALGSGALVDVTLAGTRYDTMKKVLTTLMEDPATGMLVVAVGSSAQFNPELAVKPIIDSVREATAGAAPIVAIPIPHAPDSLELLRQGGVTAFGSIEAGAEAVAMMVAPVRQRESRASALPPAVASLIDEAASSSSVLDEVQSARIFAALGVPFPAHRLLPPGETGPAANGLEFPVVAKIVSPDLPHKSDAGAIRLGLRDEGALAAAMTEMREEVRRKVSGFRDNGTLVQEMRRGLGEALVGMTRDPLVGPILTVAAGGILAEIYEDAALCPAPITLDDAHRMIAEVKGFAPLRGYRGAPRGDLDALAGLMVSVSHLLADERIEEAELNPVMVLPEGQGVVAVDALIRISTPS